MANIVKLVNIKRALNSKPSKTIIYSISGRVKNFRQYKKFSFIELEDGSSEDHLQLVVNKELIKKPEIGSYVRCQGNLSQSLGDQQALEFKVAKVDYISRCDPMEYPLLLSPPDASNDWHRGLPHLRPRIPHFASLLRVRSELELAIHMMMKQMDFFLVQTPKLSSNDCEASSDLFIVQRSQLPKSSTQNTNNERILRSDYFPRQVFLTTSAQLHLENLAASLSRVYTISSTFRAENSLSRRHLCEFSMFEAEEANVTDIESLMTRVESLIKFIAQYLKEVSEHKEDFDGLVVKNSNQEIYEKLVHKSYIKMTYSQALDILKNKANFPGNTQYGCDIGRKHEKELLEYCNNVPIFITNYPKQLKPFYMKCHEDDKEAECFDLIVPICGEVCGGSLREHDCDKLLKNLAPFTSNKLDGWFDGKEYSVDDGNRKNHNYFDWYLDSRRYGSFPHGGFGIGIERLLQVLLGIRNIKDTTAFPRWPGHCPM